MKTYTIFDGWIMNVPFFFFLIGIMNVLNRHGLQKLLLTATYRGR